MKAERPESFHTLPREVNYTSEEEASITDPNRKKYLALPTRSVSSTSVGGRFLLVSNKSS